MSEIWEVIGNYILLNASMEPPLNIMDITHNVYGKKDSQLATLTGEYLRCKFQEEVQILSESEKKDDRKTFWPTLYGIVKKEQLKAELNPDGISREDVIEMCESLLNKNKVLQKDEAAEKEWTMKILPEEFMILENIALAHTAFFNLEKDTRNQQRKNEWSIHINSCIRIIQSRILSRTAPEVFN